MSSAVVAGTSTRVDLCHPSVEDQAALVQLEEVYFPVSCQTVGDREEMDLSLRLFQLNDWILREFLSFGFSFSKPHCLAGARWFCPFATRSKRPKETTSQLTGKRCNYSCITTTLTTTQTQPCIATFVPTKPSAHHVLTYLAQGTSALASPDGWPVDTTSTLYGAK